ncbi:MAG: condensation domain-containing protein, partial [Candidatus Sulfotelmatobacter sp.]
MTKGKALSLAQERLWVLERLHPDNPANNISYGLRLTGPLDVDKLNRAWTEVVQQHEILRTGFQVADGIPQAVSLASCSAQLTTRDLENLSPQERDQTLIQLARDEARRPFDLSRAPLLRASLYHLSGTENVLLVVAHRIVCDKASLEILLRETASRYEAHKIAKAWTAASAVQYSEFLSHQGKFSEEQIAYWKKQLEGSPASLDLPIDRARPAEQTFSGASHTFSIAKSEVERLRNLGEN